MWNWGDEEVLVTRWTYKHYDGSSCRYDRDKRLWLIKRLPPLAGLSSRPEWIGAPCRYCNNGLGVVVYESKPPERTSVKLPYLKERWINYFVLLIGIVVLVLSTIGVIRDGFDGWWIFIICLAVVDIALSITALLIYAKSKGTKWG